MEQHTQAGEALLSLVCREHTLQDVLDLSARLLGTSVSFSNPAFQHRGVSVGYPQYDVDDRTRYRELHRHDLMYREMISVMESKSDHTPFILHTTGPRDRWISKAYYAGRHVGHFTCIDDKLPLEKIDTALAALCCDACAITFAMENGHQNLPDSMSTDSALFESLLYGRFALASDFSYSARLHAFQEYRFYRVLCILGRRPTDAYTRDRLMQLLSVRKTGVCSTVFQSALAVMLGSDAPFPFGLEPQLAAELTHFCQSQDITIGFSDPFSDILQVRSYYDTAQCAAQYAQASRQGGRLMEYDACKTALLFRDAKAHIARPANYIARRVQEIADYDRSHDTQYLETLRQYLLCSCSPQRAGEALYIHKNTVIYRIAQMTRLFSLNLSDAQERFCCLFSLHLMEDA